MKLKVNIYLHVLEITQDVRYVACKLRAHHTFSNDLERDLFLYCVLFNGNRNNLQIFYLIKLCKYYPSLGPLERNLTISRYFFKR